MIGVNVVEKTEIEKYQPDCAVLELTLRCNFRCLHCGGSAGNERKSELSQTQIQDVVSDLKRIGFRRISLIGGEPFLRPEWFEIAKYIKASGLLLTFVTNGSLFPKNKQLVSQVVETEPQVVGFSLDGGKAETHDGIRQFEGSFERVFESINTFKNEGIDVSVITAVNRRNISELPQIRDLLLGKGIGWQIQICSHNGKRFSEELFITKEEYTAVAEFIHESTVSYSVEELPIAGADDIGYFSSRFPNCSINRECWDGCKAGRTNIGIRSNGDVIGCDSLPDSFVEGNVTKRSLYEIWHDPESFWYTRKFEPSMLKGFCASCEHGAKCKGGCVDMSLSLCGHPFENTYCLHKQESEDKGDLR